MNKSSGLTAKKKPDFNGHGYLIYYRDLIEKYNAGDTDDAEEPTDLVVSVIGHTHQARLVSRKKDSTFYYLMDCGSWVNGGREFGIIAGDEFGICEWNI